MAVPKESTPPELELQFRTVHGYRRAFRMAGTGPPVLLLHGISDNSETWLPVMGQLAEHYTVVAPDLLGHGASDKPRADYSVAAFSNGMRDLLDLLDIDRVTVVGHSLGGGVAAQFAYQYPERAARLVLVSTGGVARDVSPILRAASAPFAELVLAPMRLPGSGLVASSFVRMLRVLGHDLGHDADEIGRVVAGLPDTAARGAFTRTLRAVVDWRGQLVTMLDRAYLAEGMPVLIAWGLRDAIIPVAHAYHAHEAMAGSRLSIYDHAGHFPHHDDPERFVAELVEFIATTQPYRHEYARRRTLLEKGRTPLDEDHETALLG